MIFFAVVIIIVIILFLALSKSKANGNKNSEVIPPSSHQLNTAPKTETKADKGNEELEKRSCVILNKTAEPDVDTFERISRKFIAFDVETTGLSRYADKIIQIGAVIFEDCQPVARFSSLVNPECHIPSRASIINHITDDMVATAPTEAQIIEPLFSFLGNAIEGETIIAAYNADFDMGFLSSMLERSGTDAKITYIDVLPLARKHVRDLSDYKQTTVAEGLGLNVLAAHSADEDAEICGQILAAVLPGAKQSAARHEKAAANKIPTPAEKGVCAYVIKLLQENGRNTSKIRFEKKSGGDIIIKHPYSFASFKLPKRNPMYFEIRNAYYSECSLPSVPKSVIDGEPYLFRITLSGIDDIALLTPSLLKGYDDASKNIDDFYMRPYLEGPDAAVSFTVSDGDIEEYITAYEQAEAAKLQAIAEKEAAVAAKEAEKIRRQQERQKKAEEKEHKSPPSMPTSRRICQYDDDMRLIKEHDSVSSAAKAVGISPKSIRDAATGKQKHAAGYVWRYSNVDQEINLIQEDSP